MRKLIILILLFCFWTAGASINARTTNISQSASVLKQKLSDIAKKKATNQRKLRAVKQQQRAVTAQLNIAEERLSTSRQHIEQLSAQLEISQKHLKKANQALQESEAKLNKHQTALSERLEQIYQSGDAGFLTMLFQTSSLGDFQNRVYLVDQFVNQDATLLEDYEAAKTEREAMAKEAEKEKERLAYLQQQAIEKHNQVAIQKEETAALKRKIFSERALWERAQAELEQDSREVEALLQRMQQTPEGRVRYSKQFAGKFLRPVSGQITSGFGYRVHPIYKVRKLHTGVDIAATSGTPIKAAADGIIIHSGRRGNYGKCVIIDHGGGVATLYGHCSRLSVSVGTEIKQGQVIGYVGSTGLSTGPHLHFEVRNNGKAVDPGL